MLYVDPPTRHFKNSSKLQPIANLLSKMGGVLGPVKQKKNKKQEKEKRNPFDIQ